MKVLSAMVMFSVGSILTRANADSGPLCTSTEKPIFSCPIGKKTLSVCASTDLSPTSGYLTYRFGASLQKVELSYPATTGHPKSFFHFFHDETSAKASVEQLSFSVDNISYTVFVERSAFEWNGSGVLIKTHGKKIGYLLCKSDRPSPDKIYDLHELGLPPAEYETDDEP
jgi:hypothetical protein